MDALKVFCKKYTMVIAMIVIWVYFQVSTAGIFLMPRNISNLFLQMCYIGICATGMVMIMVQGGIDLSVGSIIGFAGALVAVFLKNFGMPLLPAILITLVAGALIGIWHGFWIGKYGLPAFIVTLSSQWIFRGGVLGVTGESTIQPNNAAFKAIGQAFLPNIGSGNLNITALVVGLISFVIFVIIQVKNRQNRQKYNFKVGSKIGFIATLVVGGLVFLGVFGIFATDRGIPVAVVILAAVTLIMHIVANHTSFGRHIYAMGGNLDAARLSGINVVRETIINYMLVGMLAAVSGIVYTSRLNSAAIAGGNGAELDIIAAGIIGGTSPAGGKGTIFGCIIGALVMASLENGMSIMSLGSFQKYIVKGAVLLTAVAVDIISNRQKV